MIAASVGAAGLVLGATIATTSPTTQVAESSCFLNEMNHTSSLLIGVARDDFETLFEDETHISQMSKSVIHSYNNIFPEFRCEEIAQRIVLDVDRTAQDIQMTTQAAQAALTSGAAYIVSYWTVTIQCNTRCPDDGYMFGRVFNEEQRRTLSEMDELSRLLRPADVQGKQIHQDDPSISNVPSGLPSVAPSLVCVDVNSMFHLADFL